MKNVKLFWRLSGYFLISALFLGLGSGTLRAQDTYKKVSAATELIAGDEVIIVAETNAFNGEISKSWGLYVPVNVSSDEITATVGSSEADHSGPRPFIVELDGEKLSLRDKFSNNYLSGTSGSNTISYSPSQVTVTLTTSGIHDVTANANLRLNGTSGFRFYKNNGTTGTVTALYKKQGAACEPVSNVQESITATSVTLNWNAPASVPANGYKVTITDMNDDSEVVSATVTEPTYTYNNLQADWGYEYSIVSLCSEASSSKAVTGEFETPAANAKTLNVNMEGEMEGDSYIGPITFTFETGNFTLGIDGKISYMITSDGDYEAMDDITEETLVLNDLSVGAYEATFSLVDNENQVLTPNVEVTKTFSVKLPTVKAPGFSLEEQAAAFTEAQTITLSTATNGATVHYAINNGEFADYTAPIVLDKTGTFTIKAFATKAGMDTSETVSKTYKLKLPIPGIVVFEKELTSKDLDEGWEAGAIYTEGIGIRLGKGKEFGWIQLPEQHLLNKFTLYLVAQQYNSDGTKLTVTVNGKNAQTTEVLSSVAEEYVIPFTIAGNETVFADIKIEGTSTGDNARFFLKTIKIYQATETPEECNMVEGLDDDNRFEGTTATITWQVPTPAPKVGYAIEVRTDDAANTLIKRDTVKDPESGYAYKMEDLTPSTDYVFTITTLCAADRASEPADLHFHMPAADMPTLNIDRPTGGVIRRANVSFEYKITNFKLGMDEESDGQVQYIIRGTNLSEPITGLRTDTAFEKQFTRSGKDTVWLELMDKNGDTLTTRVRARRTFTIDLPDVARPRLTPTATTHKEPIGVAILCDTVGATIYYSLNDAPYQVYTDTIKLTEEGTYTFTTFAVKPLMDTSAVYTKTYTLKFPTPLDPGVLFYEPFDGLEGAGGDISTKLDDYTELPGWTGEAVYMQVAGIAKMGTVNKNGYLQTPAIELTEGDKYLLSFDAQAWNNDSDKLTVTIGETEYEISGLVNNENVGNNNAPTQMKTFEKEFTATTATTIRFAANGTVGKSRFFLDNVKVQVASNDPAFHVSSSTLTMATVQGTPVSKKVTVTGRNLTDDITVTCPEGNFSVEPATLTKEAVMGENGAELTVTFNGNEATATETITLTHGELIKTIAVSATAETAEAVENLADLREQDADESTVYTVKGEVVVTAVDGISTWAQDASGAILIYGTTGQQYQVGDGITGIYGTLKNYNDLIELLPSGNQPAATTNGNMVTPQVVTIEELDENAAEYSSRLIRINGLTLNNAEGTWTGSTNYTATDEDGNEITIRTTITKGSYINEELPEGKFDLIAIASIFKGTAQVSPRMAEDIITDGSGGDDCGAPTALNVAIDQENLTATATWNGSAANYRVVLLSGTDTVENATVNNKTYTFTKAESNVEYGWAVASVCEDGKLVWAKGNRFTIQKTGIENANALQADVYPNPTDGVVYIRLAENARMEIFTLGGMVLRSEELVAGRNEIRLGQSGIYFIRLSNGSAATVKRVVVR